jgi:hypothetical protein
MIPFVALISVRGKESRTFRMWVPLFLIWILITPVALLLSPVVFIACLACRVNPFRGFAALWMFLTALNSTKVEVDNGGAGVSVYIL